MRYYKRHKLIRTKYSARSSVFNPVLQQQKKEFEAQLQLSYLGLIELATRTGKYKAIYAHEVYKEDEFYYEYGLHKNLVHKPVDDPNGEPVGYYAVYHLQNGGFDFAYWTKTRLNCMPETTQKQYKRLEQSMENRL